MTYRELRICLIHGAATTSTVWSGLALELSRRWPAAVISAPNRPASGFLDTEIAALIPLCTDSIVVGVSGGATLGLELAARGVPFRAAILHEPAAGSLTPGLLDAAAAALARGGVPDFATTLYGPAWQPVLAPADPDAVARDIAMFRAFEPRPASAGAGPVLVTVGGDSPSIRQDAARAMRDQLGYSVRTLPDSGHALHLEQPSVLADLVGELSRTT